jgi:hypothetical protein
MHRYKIYKDCACGVWNSSTPKYEILPVFCSFWVPRWCSGNVDITDWMYGLFWVLSSIPVNVKTVQMLFNVVWSFLLTVWQSWGCALNWSLATQKIPNPSEARGSFFEKDYIHTEDSSTSPFLLISVCKFECVSEFLTFLKKFI